MVELMQGGPTQTVITVPLVVFLSMIGTVLAMLGLALSAGKIVGAQRTTNERLAEGNERLTESVRELTGLHKELSAEVRRNSDRILSLEKSTEVQSAIQDRLAELGLGKERG